MPHASPRTTAHSVAVSPRLHRVLRACVLLGVLALGACTGFSWPREETSYQLDLQRIQELAAVNDAEAQTALGLVYEKGLGIERDLLEASYWYRAGAANGDALAAYHMGSLYERGLGVTQDYRAAAEWYGLASEQGNEAAQAALSHLYERGLGVRRDPRRADALYAIAARSWNEKDVSAPSVILAPGQDGAVTVAEIAPPISDRPAEFAVGEREHTASLKVDLTVLDEAEVAVVSLPEFDGPAPVAGTGERYAAGTAAPRLATVQEFIELKEPPAPEPAAVAAGDVGGDVGEGLAEGLGGDPVGAAAGAAAGAEDFGLSKEPPSRPAQPETVLAARGPVAGHAGAQPLIYSAGAAIGPGQLLFDGTAAPILRRRQPIPDVEVEELQEEIPYVTREESVEKAGEGLAEEVPEEIAEAKPPRNVSLASLIDPGAWATNVAKPDGYWLAPVADPEPLRRAADPKMFADVMRAAKSIDVHVSGQGFNLVDVDRLVDDRNEALGATSHRIRLGTVWSPEAARRAWQALRQRYPVLLDGLALELKTVSFVEDDGFVRLDAGPLETRAAADALCAKLRDQGQACRAVMR